MRYNDFSHKFGVVTVFRRDFSLISWGNTETPKFMTEVIASQELFRFKSNLYRSDALFRFFYLCFFKMLLIKKKLRSVPRSYSALKNMKLP